MRPPCCPMDLHCDTQNVRVCRAVTLRARRRLPLHKWGAVSPIRHLFATDQRPARVVGGRRLPDPVVREGRASMTGVGGAVLPDPSMPRIRRRGIYRAGVQRATQRVAPTRFGDASLVRRPGASNGRCWPGLVGIRRCLDPPARAGRRTSAQRDGHGMAPMVERTGVVTAARRARQRLAPTWSTVHRFASETVPHTVPHTDACPAMVECPRGRT